MKSTGNELNFDHYNAEFAADPYPVLAELRERCPVAHSEAHGGFWLATRYEDIREIAQDPETFSSRYSSVPKDVGFGDFCVPPLHLDPPEHTRSKRLLAGAFVPERVERFRESIRSSVVSLIDGLRDQEIMDLSYDFARLVPTSVVCQLVGCPSATDRFTYWVEGILEQASENPENAAVVALDMFTHMSEVVAERRANPGDDVLSMLSQAEIDGDRLSDEEIVYTAVLLVLAGIDTAWSTLASAILHLATHPEDQQRLRDDRGLITGAREEFLRAYAPVTVGRVVARDTVFHGADLKEGEMVLISLPSANRDESVFPDADEVRIDREKNRHLAFGSGIHRCLGVNIARMELSIALEELLDRIPTFELADDDVDWTLGQVRNAKHVRVRVVR